MNLITGHRHHTMHATTRQTLDRSALHHTTSSRADNGDDMSEDDDGNDDDNGGDESRKVGNVSHLPHARGSGDGRAGGRARTGVRTGGRTGGRAGDDARTGGRTSGASMGRTYGRSCACAGVRGRVFRVVPPRDPSAPPRRTHRGMHRQVGVPCRRSTKTTRAGD